MTPTTYIYLVLLTAALSSCMCFKPIGVNLGSPHLSPFSLSSPLFPSLPFSPFPSPPLHVFPPPNQPRRQPHTFSFLSVRRFLLKFDDHSDGHLSSIIRRIDLSENAFKAFSVWTSLADIFLVIGCLTVTYERLASRLIVASRYLSCWVAATQPI